MRKYSYFYEGIYEKKLGIMRRGVALYYLLLLGKRNLLQQLLENDGEFSS